MEDELDMSSYVIIEKAKNDITSMLTKVNLVDMEELDDDDLEEAVKFIYSVDTRLINNGTDEEKINRLRNLAVTLFTLIRQGRNFKY